MISSDRSSILAAWTEYRFKKTQIFTFKILVKQWSQETDSLETRAVSIEIFVMLKFTERPKTPRMTSKKNIAFPEGNKPFAGDFVLIWMKQRLIWFNLQIDGTRNGFSNIKETFSENLQLRMLVLYQSMSIFQGWSLNFI